MTQLKMFLDIISAIPKIIVFNNGEGNTVIKYELYDDEQNFRVITSIFDEKGNFVKQKLGTEVNK